MEYIISLIKGDWQLECYFVPTFSNIPDNQNRKPNSSMENPMRASTATGRAVVSKEHTMAFMAHPMATNRTVVNKDTTSAKNQNSNSNAVKNEHKTIANPMLPSTTVTNSTVVWNSISLKALCCQRQYYVVPTVNNAPGSLDGRPDSSTANPMIISTATNSAVAIVTEGNASAKNSNRYLHTVKGGSTVSIQHFITKTITSAAKLSAVFSNKPNDLDSNFKSSTTSSLDSFNSTPDGLYSKPDDFNSVHTTFTF